MADAFVDTAKRLLLQAWRDALMTEGNYVFDLDLAIAADRVFAGDELGYRKAIIIQAAGKAADPSLDAQAMQKGSGVAGSWDAREFAKRVFVPWNKEAGSPFAHAADPYVSNPYRIPRFEASVREQRQRKGEFDNALAVLEFVNKADDVERAYQNLAEIVYALRRFVAGRSVDYPLPNRASMAATRDCVNDFVDQRSGGSRLQAVVLALFKSLANGGMSYRNIHSRHVNASDASTNAAGDVSFAVDDASSAIEVKDKVLSKAEFDATVEKCRVANVTEAIIVIRAPIMLAPDLAGAVIEAEISRQFSSGLNLYVIPFPDLLTAVITIIGEQGRRFFLEEVGRSLGEQNADIVHKWAWAELVKAI